MIEHDAAESDAEFLLLAEQITRETSFRCASYKDKCLRRRIAVRMRANGVRTYGEYRHLLRTDKREYQRLLDVLTINVTRFFRNWPTFEFLSQHVIPALWEQPGAIRVWSAGSSSGEEPYSLAMLIHQHAARVGEVARLSRVTVIGSDIDRASLTAARSARYAPTAFTETPADLLDQYFPRIGAYRTVFPEVKALVHFEERDVLHDRAPDDPFDLVICRNVIIYFERAAQEEVLLKFHHALRPGGFLILGRAETLLGRPRAWFRPVDLRERIFQRKLS